MKTHFSVSYFWVSLEAWQGIRWLVDSVSTAHFPGFQGQFLVIHSGSCKCREQTQSRFSSLWFSMELPPTGQKCSSSKLPLSVRQRIVNHTGFNDFSPPRFAASMVSEKALKKARSELSDPLLFPSWEENNNLVLFSWIFFLNHFLFHTHTHTYTHTHTQNKGKNLEIELPYDPEIPLLGLYPEETRILGTYFTARWL